MPETSTKSAGAQCAQPIFAFDNSYARLPERFYAKLPPTPVKSPDLIRLNNALARQLGLDPAQLASSEGIQILAGNRLAQGSEPLAMAYAGHQFGNWSPQLGDGRAILLGEIVDQNSVRRDIQLKGAGPTPFSRNGDGRAAIGPVLREYIVSEAMAALGIPTTRALAAVVTGEWVRRETALPGAILTRVARSHVRVGTFQYFYSQQDTEALRLLAEHVAARHYPETLAASKPIRALLDAIIAAQANLVARWLMAGFIHGVMNTDNMSVSGETIDYGPCAFLDAYHPGTVFSSIDHAGRYAYANQPRIARWNLSALAHALSPLLGETSDQATNEIHDALATFTPHFHAAWHAGMRQKLGLEIEQDGDVELGEELLTMMAENEVDFTLLFRALSEMASPPKPGDNRCRQLFENPDNFDAWVKKWHQRLGNETRSQGERQAAMRGINPAFIPRNHLVEEAIAAAMQGDLKPFDELVRALANPYADQPEFAHLQLPPRADQVVHQTFCGT